MGEDWTDDIVDAIDDSGHLLYYLLRRPRFKNHVIVENL